VDTVVETAEAGAFYEEPIRIIASDEVRTFVRERGGRLYVWMVAHRSVRATITLLETATTCPRGPAERFVRFSAGDFDLYLDSGRYAWPDELVLELKRRRRVVRAYWNNLAYVI
jgi:hypothetical protein